MWWLVHAFHKLLGTYDPIPLNRFKMMIWQDPILGDLAIFSRFDEMHLFYIALIQIHRQLCSFHAIIFTKFNFIIRNLNQGWFCQDPKYGGLLHNTHFYQPDRVYVSCFKVFLGFFFFFSIYVLLLIGKGCTCLLIMTKTYKT